MTDSELSEAMRDFAEDFRYLETMINQAHRETSK